MWRGRQIPGIINFFQTKKIKKKYRQTSLWSLAIKESAILECSFPENELQVRLIVTPYWPQIISFIVFFFLH